MVRNAGEAKRFGHGSFQERVSEDDNLTTETLTAVIYGQGFEDPHPEESTYDPVRRRAAEVGAVLPASILSAAKSARRKGFVGVDKHLSSGVEVQVIWNSPSTYVQLRRGDAFVVLRIEQHPKCGAVSFIHEIQSPATDAILMLSVLATSWPQLERTCDMTVSKRHLVGAVIVSNARGVRNGSRAAA